MTDHAPHRAAVPVRTDGILDRLAALRAADAPTHGGRVLSYVYDPGLPELDALAGAAIRAVQPLNGLDPTAFSSVAVMEREVVGFARDVLGGDDDVVGVVTTGGTESCLLAVKAAREAWRRARSTVPARGRGTELGTGQGRSGPATTPRIVAPTTVHAAFHKAAAYLGLDLDLVPVDPATGAVRAGDVVARLADDVALVVVSAPSYPYGAVDPVAEVAPAAAEQGIPVHVDACVGGWVLPFWPGTDVDDPRTDSAAGAAGAPGDHGAPVPPFDLRVPGVTSISADVHKYGYSPKGASVLLTRGRDLQRGQFFATTRWPGYPVVNATVPGSRSAGPLAAAWAVTQALGMDGYRALADRCAGATATLTRVLAGIRGLRVVGEPVGPLLAVTADDAVPPAERVDPHLWADRVRAAGWVLQPQPGSVQADGTRLPHTTHLTITPVTADVTGELGAVLVRAANEVRGAVRPEPQAVLAGLVAAAFPGVDPAAALSGLDDLGADQAWGLLHAAGLGQTVADPASGLPADFSTLMALVEALPAPVAERLLVELIARLTEPRPVPGVGESDALAGGRTVG